MKQVWKEQVGPSADNKHEAVEAKQQKLNCCADKTCGENKTTPEQKKLTPADVINYDAKGQSMEELNGEDDDWEVHPSIADKTWDPDEFAKHPLFMKSTPTDEEIEKNVELQALQALLYEGKTQKEVVEALKQHGNELLKDGERMQALRFYTRSIEEECAENIDDLRSLCYSNRAMVHFTLGNWPNSLSDSRRAVELDAKNVKACWRGAKAALTLELPKEADRLVKLGLATDDKNDALLKLRIDVDRDLGKKVDLSRKEKEKRAKKLMEARISKLAKMRKLTLAKPLYDLPDHMDKFSITDDGQGFNWSCMLFIGECNQMDFVESLDDGTCLNDQLKMIYPGDSFAEWDVRQRYSWNTVVTFLEIYCDESAQSTYFVKIDGAKPVDRYLVNVAVPRVLGFHIFVEESPRLRVFLERSDIRAAP